MQTRCNQAQKTRKEKPDSKQSATRSATESAKPVLHEKAFRDFQPVRKILDSLTFKPCLIVESWARGDVKISGILQDCRATEEGALHFMAVPESTGKVMFEFDTSAP